MPEIAAFQKFFPLVKVDVAQRIVHGLVTAEREDKDGEFCHYDSTKPQYKAINDELGKASDGENIMPLREMHQLKAVGAGKTIEFDDTNKQILMSFKVVDDDAWKKVCEKVLLGFSQGGKYVKRWKEDGKNFYTAQPGEVSLVDNPCLSGAFIDYVKADGTVEKFQTAPDIGSALDTLSKKVDSLASDLAKYSTAGDRSVNKEQLQKAADALGITVEEFQKQFIPTDELVKAKKGLAALHEHISAAQKEHEGMAKAHDKISAHLGKCMKACTDVMGSDEKESKKALKALVDELKGAPADDESAKAAAKAAADKAAADAAASTLTKAEVDKLVADAVEKAVKALPAPDPAGLRVVPRGGTEVAKATAAQDTNASPY